MPERIADHPVGLRRRSDIAERMDTDCADYEDYRRCLADLARVNAVTLTHRATLAWLAREARGLASFSLLDVACGHGDMLRRVRRWARQGGVEARLTGIDRHPWAVRAALEATPAADAIEYMEGDVFGFDPPSRFDFIVSSQFLHHLSDSEAVAFIRWQEAHAARGWFIADLHRHWFSYRGFPLLARALRWHRFVRLDGQVSIARAFLPDELRALIQAAGVPDGAARVSAHAPLRLSVARRWTAP